MGSYSRTLARRQGYTKPILCMQVLRTRPLLSVLILIALLALNGATLYAIFEKRPEVLRVSFLDVGQGDAVLVESPEGVQLLIDGGRDRSVVRELPLIIGPLDRSIDMVLATHPDADHIGGLPEVFSRYRIGYYLAPGIIHDTPQVARLAEAVTAEGVVPLAARRGMRIHLGKDVYADLLYPDHDVRQGATNAGSVVMKIVYGDTSFMLTGDAPVSVEEYLVTLDGDALDSDVLKAGHHGSRTSTSAGWLSAVTPDTVVISAGKDNSYGHPHEEVVIRIQGSGAALVSTITEGTMTFISDGRIVTRK